MQGSHRRGARPVAIVVALVAALLLTSCIGTVSREEFDEEVRSRGGGFDQDLVLDAVDDLARRLGTDDLAVRTFSVTPSAGSLVVEVRDPRNPSNLDRYVYRNGSLQSSEPVQLSADDDLDQLTIPLSGFALDRLDAMVDDALAEYGVDGGYVDGVRLQWSRSIGDGAVESAIVIGLQSPRSTAEAIFTADGELVAVELR